MEFILPWAGGWVGNIRTLPSACQSFTVQDHLEIITNSKSLRNLHHQGIKLEIKYFRQVLSTIDLLFSYNIATDTFYSWGRDKSHIFALRVDNTNKSIWNLHNLEGQIFMGQISKGKDLVILHLQNTKEKWVFTACNAILFRSFRIAFLSSDFRHLEFINGHLLRFIWRNVPITILRWCLALHVDCHGCLRCWV